MFFLTIRKFYLTTAFIFLFLFFCNFFLFLRRTFFERKWQKDPRVLDPISIELKNQVAFLFSFTGCFILDSPSASTIEGCVFVLVVIGLPH